MNNCKNCGRMNDATSIFCRFCGTKFGAASQAQFEYSAPRPYSWKTAEFQTKSEARNAGAGVFGAPVTLHGYSAVPAADPRVRCPRCSSFVVPRIERKISTAGWVTFAALLVFTVIFFWIGLLIKENVAFCPVCEARLS